MGEVVASVQGQGSALAFPHEECMTLNDRFRAAFDAAGWSHIALARMLRVNEREVRRWYNGENKPPQRIVEWLERVAAWLADNPPPEKI